MGCAQSNVAAVSAACQDVEEVSVTPCNRNFHDEYALHDKLGKGAFAVVYSAARTDTPDVEVAVKVVDLRRASAAAFGDEEAQDAKRLRGITREVQLLHAVAGSDEVIRIFGSYVHQGLAYIILEKCDKTLFQALTTLPMLNEETLRPFFRGMLRGLAYAHSRGVCHRDVKPDNFMCKGPKDTVKLCDFGLAQSVSSECMQDCVGVYGTPPYMAPEMLRGLNYNTKVDTWSVGVIVYTLCFGNFPYVPAQPSGPAMKAAIAAGLPVPSYRSKGQVGPGFLSDEIMQFMRELLYRDPGGRPGAANALQHPFFRSSRLSMASLRPALYGAKRMGAFDVPQGRQAKPTAVEARLRELSHMHQPRVSPAKMDQHTSEASTEAETAGGYSARTAESQVGHAKNK